MSHKNGIHVALVGLGFGAEFLPIYLNHPLVGEVTICDSDQAVLKEVGDTCEVQRRYASLDNVLADQSVDAVHLVTPIPLHAVQALAVLESCKHCACTVPAATNIEDLKALVAAQARSGKNYMMMETAVYTREFMLVKELLAAGTLGQIQFLRGAHYQDMENWPSYWRGLPPMHYSTHAVAPLLALADSRATRVHCFGSGHMRAELHEQYANPYPVETAIFQFEHDDLAAEVTRSLFHTAREYAESFNIYGDAATYEWQQLNGDEALLFKMAPLQPNRGRPITIERLSAPDRADLLPSEIRRFTKRGVYDESNAHLSFLQGGGHSRSHPHLVHEFVSSIDEGRLPCIDAVKAATWTAPGICAHQAALNGGELTVIPSFG